MSDLVEKTDGRGILSGAYLGEDRDISRDDWLREVFPEWGSFLNKEINCFSVRPGSVALWWFGGPSFAMKTSGGEVFLIDNYAGPSIYTTYDNCGVCRTSVAPSLNWLRLGPQVVDPWAFARVDAAFSTHQHQDHCDIYTVKAAIETTECVFVGPAAAVEKFRKFRVPKGRVQLVAPGSSLTFGTTKVECLMNYDSMAAITGVDSPHERRRFEEVAVSYLFKTDGGSILFLADTLYNNAYVNIGANHKVDVACMNMGHAAPGATDKMSPYDAMRVAQAVRAKVILPMHYDNWANSQEDPGVLEWLVQRESPSLKTVILQPGARFVYPDDQDVGRYRYPDYAEMYRPEMSWEYGGPSR
ncbi:MAG: MBL fold metallo-hydrolase [Acidimicrobiales bacterium]